jgi:hypothetical protein
MRPRQAKSRSPSAEKVASLTTSANNLPVIEKTTGGILIAQMEAGGEADVPNNGNENNANEDREDSLSHKLIPRIR